VRLRQKHRAGCSENVKGTEVNSTVIVLYGTQTLMLAFRVGMSDEEWWKCLAWTHEQPTTSHCGSPQGSSCVTALRGPLTWLVGPILAQEAYDGPVNQVIQPS